MSANHFTITDFSIGECVVPADVEELPLVIVDIDKKNGKIICRTLNDTEPMKYKFTPLELEKKPIVTPAYRMIFDELENDNINPGRQGFAFFSLHTAILNSIIENIFLFLSLSFFDDPKTLYH